MHLDDLRGVDDRHVGGQLAGDRANALLVPDEDEVIERVARRIRKGPGDDLLGAVIAAHDIDRDAYAAVEGDPPDRAHIHGRGSAERQDFDSEVDLTSIAWRPL